jgi:HAD superfamily PSPase-like hydrolase
MIIGYLINNSSDVKNMSFKAVAFDLDGTLVAEKSSWWTLHKFFGTYEQSVQNMKSYEQAKITYDKFMELDISLWKPRPHISIIRKILLNYTLTLNAKSVTDLLHRRGYFLFIVTTAPDILADAVAAELNISHVASNGFIFDNKGYLTQKAVFRVDLMKKEIAFRKLIAEAGVKCEECVAVGDSKYDVSFLNAAGLGIAYNPDSVLEKEAKTTIADMNELLAFV